MTNELSGESRPSTFPLMSPVCRGPVSGINSYDRLAAVTFNFILISHLDSLRSTHGIASYRYASSLGT